MCWHAPNCHAQIKISIFVLYMMKWLDQDESQAGEILFLTLRSVKCGAARSSALRRDSAACRAAAGGGSGAARVRRLHRRLPRAVGAGGRGGDRDGARKQRRELRDDPRRRPRDAAGVLRLHQQGDGRRACRCWAQGSAARPAGGGCAWPPARGLTVCARGSQERLLFNCPEGTQRLMSQNKLKLSNKVSFAAGDRAGALLCSLRAEGGCGCPRAAPRDLTGAAGLHARRCDRCSSRGGLGPTCRA